MAGGAARVLALSRTVMLSPSVTLTTLPVRVSAKAMETNTSRNAATITRPMLVLCESIVALFFRAVRTPLDRKIGWELSFFISTGAVKLRLS